MTRMLQKNRWSQSEEWYLYLMMEDGDMPKRLSRLNLTQLCKRPLTPPPMEVIQVFSRRTEIPGRMKFQVVDDSRVYMHGGRWGYVPNRAVYAFNPTHPTRGPFINLCHLQGVVPKPRPVYIPPGPRRTQSSRKKRILSPGEHMFVELDANFNGTLLDDGPLLPGNFLIGVNWNPVDLLVGDGCRQEPKVVAYRRPQGDALPEMFRTLKEFRGLFCTALDPSSCQVGILDHDDDGNNRMWLQFTGNRSAGSRIITCVTTFTVSIVPSKNDHMDDVDLRVQVHACQYYEHARVFYDGDADYCRFFRSFKSFCMLHGPPPRHTCKKHNIDDAEIIPHHFIWDESGICMMNWSNGISGIIKGSIAHQLSHSSTLSLSSMKKKKKKNGFLYLIIPGDDADRICRLNIDDFCKGTHNPKPRFEVVHLFEHKKLQQGGTGSTTAIIGNNILVGMKHVTVGSKVYMYGGELELNNNEPNLDVYSFDPTNPKGPFIRLLDDKEQGEEEVMTSTASTSPRLIDPEDRARCVFFTLDGKIYVRSLAKSSSNKLVGFEWDPFLKVFDSSERSWNLIPDFHCDNRFYRDADLALGWGHKLYFTGPKSYWESYMFDTRQQKWEDAADIHGGDGYNRWIAAAELGGFLIVVTASPSRIVAYRLDSNSIPRPYRVLHELQPLFSSCYFGNYYCLLGKCDDDDDEDDGGRGGHRMWLVYPCATGEDEGFIYTRVAVFRVSVDHLTSTGGNPPVLSAEIEATKLYELGNRRYDYCSAFVMFHNDDDQLSHQINSVEDNCKKKNLFGKVLPHF